MKTTFNQIQNKANISPKSPKRGDLGGLQHLLSAFLFTIFTFAFFSCQLGEEAENVYYGSFYAANAKLSNCDLTVKFNGDSLGVLRPEGFISKSNNLQYKDGTTGILAFYKGNTLVCDTLISIKANMVKDSIEVIYSDRYKKYGFWDSKSMDDFFKVAPDSMKWELRYEDKTAAKLLSNIEVTFGYYLSNYTFVKRNNSPVLSFKSGNTDPSILSFGFNDNSGKPLKGVSNCVAVKIKNTGTNKYITDSNGYADFNTNIPTNKNGKYLECVLEITDGKSTAKITGYVVTVSFKELN